MNKILLNSDDVDFLFNWRDNHKEMVREGLMPIKDINIVVENGVSIKAYRKGDRLTEYIYNNGKSYGKVIWNKQQDGYWELIRDDVTVYSDTKRDFVMSCLSIYGTVMAFFVYGNTPPAEVVKIQNRGITGQNKGNSCKSKTNPTDSITYILKNNNGERTFSVKGSHNSPNGQFSVRGHYRHLHNGNVIWISQYIKGAGKKNKTTYKVGNKT